jgi:hypothetical protein
MGLFVFLLCGWQDVENASVIAIAALDRQDVGEAN